ncbi:hypothetical protein BZJ19_01400 [Salinivibrio proteolyticus]|jgi:hypothetical protein|uniref:Uncharacterized protein n=2 Tax=Salinivibrio TaxID=51366 RepID=A0ABY7LJ61_9GAMM|nr:MULTISPECIES: hypothetical protein [Salinivibrio]OOF20677.1 hypothetical protein BZJ17_12290 [Salinivibrio sp. IB574]OOF27463.1 hypothetical protein BZJ19_01400 [Salinivibrio proteolyticus]PCE65293.1 hypothetical protein B6G00_15020 [Salinivibrio sp. YCSC6]QCF37667.1 hypothetical protein E8E00_15840 [Salinivibrio sp. YCSC6]QIR07837.1 hypothetical protein HBA18_15725 [Salinivibrio costicola]
MPEENGITPSPYRDRVDPKVADQTTSTSAQSLNLDGLRDLSALSKLQVREFTHTGATQMQATSNAMTQMAAAGAKAVNYIMDGGN